MNHGDYLSLDLPERTEKLDFTSADEKDHITIWQHRFSVSNKVNRGRVSSSGNGWTYQLSRVTFDDEGTYTLFNSFDKIISTYTVKVNSKGILFL